MTRDSRFTFLCDLGERRMIADLAARLQRSQSDAVRYIVIEAARQLSELDAQPVPIITIQSEQSR